MAARPDTPDVVKILGVRVHRVGLAEAAELVLGMAAGAAGKPCLVATPNAEMIYAAQTDRALRRTLERADLLVPDGAGVVWAARHLGLPVPERVPGVDLAAAVLQRLARTGGRVYLLGGRPGVSEKARERLLAAFPGLSIPGCHHGYFGPAEEEEIVADVRASRAQLLLVCLGSPKQEKWAGAHLERLGVPVSIGVGGFLDVWAGVVRRAPETFRKANLEWLYRLLIQPGRFWRMLALPKFVLAVLLRGSRPLR